MSNKRQYIWFLIELTNGEQRWFCVSRVLREAILQEKKVNQFWKNTMIGNYITVSTSKYVKGQTHLTVGKIKKISISTHKSYKENWTRNQFVTPDHLLKFKSAFNYLKHDYRWYNRFAIWVAMKYWYFELLQVKIKRLKKKINKRRGRIINKYRKQKNF